MTTEEKAKAYDEAIKKIKGYTTDEYGCARLKPLDIFPELAESEDESEDERIRKAIIKWFKAYNGVTKQVHPELINFWITWLEKQGEQKPAKDIKIWTIQDAKDGDILAYNNSIIILCALILTPLDSLHLRLACSSRIDPRCQCRLTRY